MHSSFSYRGRRMECKARDFSSRRPPSFAKKRRSAPYRYSRCAGVQSEVKSALALKPNIEYSGSSLKRERLLWGMTSVYSAKVLSSLRISRSQHEAQPPLQPPRAERPPIPTEQIWRVSTPPHTLSVCTELQQIIHRILQLCCSIVFHRIHEITLTASRTQRLCSTTCT